jgi:hypothetical protein
MLAGAFAFTICASVHQSGHLLRCLAACSTFKRKSCRGNMLPTALSLGHYGEWFVVVAATIRGEHRMVEKYPTLEGLGFSDRTLCSGIQSEDFATKHSRECWPHGGFRVPVKFFTSTTLFTCLGFTLRLLEGFWFRGLDQGLVQKCGVLRWQHNLAFAAIKGRICSFIPLSNILQLHGHG